MLAVFGLYCHVLLIGSTMTSDKEETRLAPHLPSLRCYQDITVVASFHFMYHECLESLAVNNSIGVCILPTSCLMFVSAEVLDPAVRWGPLKPKDCKPHCSLSMLVNC